MEHDFELKVRLNTVFWALSCYTRLEVKLAGYSLQRQAPMELTDLDVLGIRVLPDLAIDYLVADCTSNRRVVGSPIQRVFWLRGVMDLFGASRGYLSLDVHAPVAETQRTVASRLDVTILNQENLSNLERRVGVEEGGRLKLSDPASWTYLENNLSTLPHELLPVLEFRKYRYWMTRSNERIHALLALLAKYAALFSPGNRFFKALAVDLLGLLTLSILQMSSYVSRVNPENPELELKSYFYGGHTEMRRRETIVENIKRIIMRTPGQRQLFEDTLKLDPEYLPRLFDIAFRFLNRPADAAQLPRYFQSVLFEKVLYRGENKDGLTFLDRGFSDVTKKLGRDAAKFLCEATRVSEVVVEDILEASPRSSGEVPAT